MKALNIVLIVILLLAIVGIVYHFASAPQSNREDLHKYPGIVQKMYTITGIISPPSCAGYYNNGTCAYYSYYLTMNFPYLIRYNGTSLNQLGNFTMSAQGQAMGFIPFVFPPFNVNSTVWVYVRSGQIQEVTYRL